MTCFYTRNTFTQNTHLSEIKVSVRFTFSNLIHVTLTTVRHSSKEHCPFDTADKSYACRPKMLPIKHTSILQGKKSEQHNVLTNISFSQTANNKPYTDKNNDPSCGWILHPIHR